MDQKKESLGVPKEHFNSSIGFEQTLQFGGSSVKSKPGALISIVRHSQNATRITADPALVLYNIYDGERERERATPEPVLTEQLNVLKPSPSNVVFESVSRPYLSRRPHGSCQVHHSVLHLEEKLGVTHGSPKKHQGPQHAPESKAKGKTCHMMSHVSFDCTSHYKN